MPRLFAPLAFFLCFACFLLLPIGCASSHSVIVHDGDGSRWVRKGDQWSIQQVDSDDGSVLSAELIIEQEESSGEATYRIERLELFPPGDAMGRLWRLLPARSVLRAADGETLEHPDGAVLAELGVEPSLDEVLLAMPKFIHADSRGEALGRVAAGRKGSRSFDEVLAVIEAGEGGPLGGLGPDSLPVGGSVSRASSVSLDAFATRTDLGSSEFDRLPGYADRFSSSKRATAFLRRLVGKASTGSIAVEVGKLPSSKGRAEVLTDLAQAPDLTEEGAAAIVTATSGIGSSKRQTEVLVSVSEVAPVGVVLDVVPAIGSSAGRTEVLLALTRRRPLTVDDLDAIARATSSIGSSSGQTKVLGALVESAPVEAILVAVPGIGSSQGRGVILTSLARQPGLGAEEAAEIARASADIGSSSLQGKVLRELIGIATVDAILEAIPAIGSTAERRKVLVALARTPELTPAEGAQLAGATSLLPSSPDRAEVLTALIGRAPASSIRTAAGAISSKHHREEVLKQLGSSDR